MKRASEVRLTSAELANLWKVYLIENLLIQFKIPLIETCQDQEIKNILLFALDMSKTYVKDIEAIYTKENHPIPLGFSKEDINLNAPALFSDSFSLHYIHEMSKLGFRIIPEAIESTVRQDVLDCFFEAYLDYKELYQKSLDLLVSKGIYRRPPSIPIREKVTFIENQHYLSGWLGKQRPLNAFEIMNVYNTIQRNGISKAILLAFSQVVQDKEVRDYMLRGVKNANHIIKDFEDVCLKENISLSPTFDSEIFSTSISPYSDKLMMMKVTQMGAGSIGIYGTNLASVFRRDLGAKYIDIIKDALAFAEDGTNLLIKKGWLEEPPAREDVGE